MSKTDDAAARPKRRRRTPEEAREEILSAAEKILIEVGPQGLKLADVAAAAGEPHSTLLHHFGSIGNVQKALISRMSSRLMAEVTALALKADGSGDIAAAAIDRVFEIYARPENAKLIAWLALSNNAEDQKALEDQSLRLREILREHLVATGRPERATPANLAGIVSIPMMAAVGETMARGVIAKGVVDDLPERQTRDWIAELVIAKLGVRTLR